MKSLYRLFAAAASAAFFMASAHAQQGTVTQHAYAIGKGAGFTGYTSLLCGSAQLAVGQAAADPVCQTITGDVTLTAGGVTALGNIPSGVPVAGSLLWTAIAAPATPAAGKAYVWVDSTDKRLHDKNDAGVIGTTVVAGTCSSHNWFNTLSSAGALGCSQPSFTDLTGSLSCAQHPALTGDVTNSAGSCATTIAANAVTNAKMATMAANTVKANATGGAATPTDVAPASARSSSLLNIDQFTGHGDSIYTILATDRTVGTNAAFTASRTWTLPAANAVNPGQEIIVADFQGTVTGVNTLVISRAGADTINGVTSVTIASANGAYLFKSDGSSKWSAQALGSAAAGGVTSVTCGTGLTGGTITTSGTCAVSLSNVANSLGADVSLNNTATFFDGPSTAQGTSGTWLATGNVSLIDSAGAASFICKLWDGTTIIDSSVYASPSANLTVPVSLSGVLASPSANIKISCKDVSSTSGKIQFNPSGTSKDSTLTVVRIQ